MSEAIRSVIMGQGTVEINGKKLNKYIIGAILITDEKIEGANLESEFVALQATSTYSPFTDIMSRMKKYKSRYALGDMDQALLRVSEMSLDDDLEPV